MRVIASQKLPRESGESNLLRDGLDFSQGRLEENVRSRPGQKELMIYGPWISGPLLVSRIIVRSLQHWETDFFTTTGADASGAQYR